MSKPRLKPIPGFMGYYADDSGNIWSAKPSRWGYVKWKMRKLGKSRDKYFDVVLNRSNGVKVNKPVHTLVALAFYGKRPNGMVTSHVNGNREDNRVCNLKYVTCRDNVMDKVSHGTMVRGDKSHLSKLTDGDYVGIAQLIKNGVSQTEIAKQYDISVSTVWGFRTGKIRKHQSYLLQ